MRQPLEVTLCSPRFGSAVERPGDHQAERAVSPSVVPSSSGIVSGDALLDVFGRADIECSIGAAGQIDVVRFRRMFPVHSSFSPTPFSSSLFRSGLAWHLCTGGDRGRGFPGFSMTLSPRTNVRADRQLLCAVSPALWLHLGGHRRNH